MLDSKCYYCNLIININDPSHTLYNCKEARLCMKCGVSILPIRDFFSINTNNSLGIKCRKCYLDKV